jgi:hypothetical protein
MKRSKPMNRQLALSLGPEPATYEIATELELQQWEELESILAELLLNVAINIGTYRGEDND